MKIPKLGDFLFWKGKLAHIICRADTPTFTIQMYDKKCCPHCKKEIGVEQFSVVAESPLFQNNAEPIQTIKSE